MTAAELLEMELAGADEDSIEEFRSGQFDTGLPSQSSRHYSCREVAAQLSDGTYVGWTYWFGGGKHGEPSSVPWIEEAYELEVTEAMCLVKVFKRKE